MCGRFTNLMTWAEIVALYGLMNVAEPQPGWKPKYNAAPTQRLPVLRLSADGHRDLSLLKWGLIPSWAREAKVGNSLINARAEGVAEKPSFRSAFKKRRCLIPADGFYEWQKRPAGGKQPWRITLADGAPFSFGGLWESWRSGDEAVETFTIITTTANELMAPLHDRMPVIIDPGDYDAWLESADTMIPMLLLQPYPAARMRAYPVSTKVNSPRNDVPEVIEPVAA